MKRITSEEYFKRVVELKLYSNEKFLKVKLKSVFGDIDFYGKNVLDIGGGKGLYTFYAAVMGARNAVCLEPEDSGSRNDSISKFSMLKNDLSIDNAELERNTFQEYQCQDDYFDIILLHSSINHLDENACINLHRSESAKNIYMNIFTKIYKCSKKGAKLIVCDCSNRNFYADLGMKNPFARSIEWFKHQDPVLWEKLLVKAGFKSLGIKWSVPNYFGKIGKLLFGHRVGSYLLTSVFCLTLVKPE